MPEELRAKEIINLRDRELAKQATFRSLWQETADLMFPRENQITGIQTSGTDKSRNIFNTTAVFDSQDMASGLSAAFIPSGQLFFGLKAKDRELSQIDRVRRYLSIATEITHDELFESNFMRQFNETFFARPKSKVIAEYQRRVDNYLGPGAVTTDHIAELHDVGYLP
ncbi:hypothetical protein LCGC14_3129670, partial [marine sediment metagenome]